jgi:hypothetical protein
MGVEEELEDLGRELFTPGKEGTLQQDLITAVRRRGLVSAPVRTTENLLRELHNGRPVLVFQNLGLSWAPSWHYAVAVGYDLRRDELILHTGKTSNARMRIRTFEHTWRRTDNWAMVIATPGEVPVSSSELDLVNAGAGLELAKHYPSALAVYRSVLERWPSSLGAMLGLGNTHFAMKEPKRALEVLARATTIHPQSPIAWHNYSVALWHLRQPKEAAAAARRAISLSQGAEKERFSIGLAELLK